MTTPNPITPPPELVQQWLAEPEYVSGWNGKCTLISVTDHRFSNICAKAAQWGADQELEACCEWLEDVDCEDPQETAKHLRAARRPKPPSLKEQALDVLEGLRISAKAMGMGFDSETIRRALEQLDD
jgi:hypothetical protein